MSNKLALNSKNFKQFLFGVATSGHQIEGNNIHSDWYHWEINNKNIENSGIACNSRNRYKEDIDIIAKLNLDVYRFSIEWSRIQPTQNTFDEKELKYYLDLISYLKSKNIKPFITLNHFTLPKWVADYGGWTNKKIVADFVKYTEFLIKYIKNDVEFIATINEPTVYIGMSYLAGKWPPQKRNVLDAYKAYKNMMTAHNRAYTVIKNANANIKVGIVNQITDYVPYNNNLFWDKFTCWSLNKIRAWLVYKPTIKKADFLGLNYYYQYRMKNFKQKPDYSLGKFEVFNWPVTPNGLYRTLVRLHKMYQKPIYITENGISDKHDKHRKTVIEKHLAAIDKAISDGAMVKGYMHWSLLDNFEWAEGYKSKFGLVKVDFENNQKRTIRDSGYYYGELVAKLKFT